MYTIYTAPCPDEGGIQGTLFVVNYHGNQALQVNN